LKGNCEEEEEEADKIMLHSRTTIDCQSLSSLPSLKELTALVSSSCPWVPKEIATIIIDCSSELTLVSFQAMTKA
jgi:hypothetical protein